MFFLLVMVSLSCNNTADHEQLPPEKKDMAAVELPERRSRHFRGVVSNGMKGDSISFDVSSDGSKMQNFLFKGYWRCSGRLEQQSNAGPQGSFTISNGKVDDHISEPPNGGATAWRYEVKATIAGAGASGTFRMNINALGCDTYVLKWTATAD
ncbi:MAG: hypothetical protein EOO13_07440 [Chitinophagaceae bacterium]|nr:MAG: hypothetical protein EOO13_07440 [Chitinophagaceae bacterium]